MRALMPGEQAKVVNFRFSTSDVNKLTTMSKTLGKSKSAIMRELVRNFDLRAFVREQRVTNEQRKTLRTRVFREEEHGRDAEGSIRTA